MSCLTRRTVLAAAALPLLGQRTAPKAVPAGERRRYADPTTEHEVFRLTDPAHTSILPSESGHCVARNNSVLYCSNRSGKMQVHRVDLKSGDPKQLTDAAALEPRSVAFLPDERTFLYVDGQTLKRSDGRDVYAAPNPLEPGLAITDDGLSAFVTERAGARWRLMQVPLLAKGSPKSLVESEQRLSGIKPRPKRASLLYLREGSLHLVTFEGQSRQLKTEGRINQVEWQPDGRTAIYLTRSLDERPQATLRETEPDPNSDRLFCRTSQFAHFARNADGSVFVGVSGSVASPLVLLLLRITRREFPLCEHRAQTPLAPPVFTPNSQRVLFQGDRDGQPALYMIALDKLVEKTEEPETR
ncbi:MAG: oligogalacturonate lyase family protein [Bryobacteraceae bacterium]|nr:oligogalacturonate lyase family protein [Bryobacteraceae bacterium]